jgi:hypothetical protein
VDRVVTTVSEIPVVELPAFDAASFGDEGPPAAPGSIWAVELPEARRPSPITLAALGVLAGIAAMVLGTAAVISASRSSETPRVPAPAPAAAPSEATPAVPAVERRVLALLAKPSSERVVFRGARGLVLVVGSGGRAAILVRGLEPAPTVKPYIAWVVRPGAAPLRAARFVGTERAVFLGRRLGSLASVVVSSDRPVAGPAARNAIVALRG